MEDLPPPPYSSNDPGSQGPALRTRVPFTVRLASESDAQAILNVDKYTIQNSLLATRDYEASYQDVRSFLAAQATYTRLTFVAVSTEPSAKYTRQSTREVLAYATLHPYTAVLRGPRSCFDRTANLSILCAGADLHPDLEMILKTSLIRATLMKVWELGLRYETVVSQYPFDEGEQTLVAHREAFLKEGFVQSGLLQKVLKKRGQLLDLIMMQKSI
jgi:hypothetical protein